MLCVRADVHNPRLPAITSQNENQREQVPHLEQSKTQPKWWLWTYQKMSSHAIPSGRNMRWRQGYLVRIDFDALKQIATSNFHVQVISPISKMSPIMWWQKPAPKPRQLHQTGHGFYSWPLDSKPWSFSHKNSEILDSGTKLTLASTMGCWRRAQFSYDQLVRPVEMVLYQLAIDGPAPVRPRCTRKQAGIFSCLILKNSCPSRYVLKTLKVRQKDIPSGKQTWISKKHPLVDDIPLKHCDIHVTDYQRVGNCTSVAPPGLELERGGSWPFRTSAKGQAAKDVRASRASR